MGDRESQKILLIEGDPAARSALEQALGMLGMDVIAVERAQQAMDLLPSSPLAVIVFTVDTGDMHDLAMMMRIREVPAGRGVPLLVLASSRVAELARVKGMMSHFDPDEYLPRDALDPGKVQHAAGRLAQAALEEAQAAADTSNYALTTPATEVTLAELRDTYSALGQINFYERLGVRVTDEPNAIRRAYLQRMQRYRPENVETGSDEARRMLRGIHDALSEAYKTLRDPKRKKVYEERLANRYAAHFADDATIKDMVAPPSSHAPPAAASEPDAPPADGEEAPTEPDAPAPPPRRPAPPKPVYPRGPANAGARWTPPAELSSASLQPPGGGGDQDETIRDTPAPPEEPAAPERPRESRAANPQELEDFWGGARRPRHPAGLERGQARRRGAAPVGHGRLRGRRRAHEAVLRPQPG